MHDLNVTHTYLDRQACHVTHRGLRSLDKKRACVSKKRGGGGNHATCNFNSADVFFGLKKHVRTVYSADNLGNVKLVYLFLSLSRPRPIKKLLVHAKVNWLVTDKTIHAKWHRLIFTCSINRSVCTTLTTRFFFFLLWSSSY
jgi:hypothetical protein